MVASRLFGLIICVDIRFQITPPTPKATTSADVTLFLESGKRTHIQLRIGIELIANMQPGMIKENIVNVYILKEKMLTIGHTRKTREQTRMTNS